MDMLPRNDRPVIGVLGVGRMGTPVVAALAEVFHVGAFDADARRADAVTAAGAEWFASADALARTADVVVTVLPGADELRRCVTDLLPRVRSGTLWIDLTSGDPETTGALADAATARGIRSVSAPMGGSVAEAAAQRLVFYAGGAAADLEHARPVLTTLAAPGGIRVVGNRPQDAQAVKLLANALWFAHAAAASEALLVGQALGIPAERLRELLAGSAGGSRFLDEHADRLLDGDYLETFGIDRVVDELDAVARMSDGAGASTPVLAASARLHRDALERYGPALGELLGVRLLEERAQRTIRRRGAAEQAG